MAGYFFFTDRGRQLRRQLEPALDDIVRELNSFRATVEKTVGAAQDGWKLLNEAMGPVPSDTRYPTSNQTSPF